MFDIDYVRLLTYSRKKMMFSTFNWMFVAWLMTIS